MKTNTETLQVQTLAVYHMCCKLYYILYYYYVIKCIFISLSKDVFKMEEAAFSIERHYGRQHCKLRLLLII